MRKTFFSVACGLGIAALTVGCKSDGRCSAGSYRAPGYRAPAYAPSNEGSSAAEPSYSPAPSYAPPAGSGMRSEPSYQGSGSR
jgi:hypothetical protein